MIDSAMAPANGLIAWFKRLATDFRHCRRAAISPMMALLLIPISGAIAVAVEQGQWYYFQRSMQNAADAGALSAAINNNSGTGSGYQAEAAATTAKFGYINGTNGASVATSIVTCPAGVATGSICYRTAISTIVPVTFSGLIGFQGDAAYGAGRGQTIPVAAIAASAGTAGHNYCLWSLSTAYNSFQSNGGPFPDLRGCSILSSGSATCNGHNLGAFYGDAAGTNSGCGITQTSGATIPPDPYLARASNIPSDTCSSYPQGSKVRGNWTVPTSNQISGSKSWTGNQQLCGDIQLTGDVTLTGTTTTVIIRNGVLDLNGKTIKTASGSTATIVFAGTAGSYLHYPTDNSSSSAGKINVQAPTSGPWSGVAMYQDPSLTSGTSFTYTGNSPAWEISGLVYLPKAALTFSGAVNKSANGSSCFLLIAYSILVNGTGNIFANNSGCAAAGLSPPSSVGAIVTRLVQ